MQRANRFIVNTLRTGVFPYFLLMDSQTNEELDGDTDRQELQDLADVLNRHEEN